MICKSGRPKLSDDQDRALFAESAGTCLLCNTTLFPHNPGRTKSIPIAERAHIIAHSDDGPRADSTMAQELRDGPDNIVLLCPTCHTKVDKAPDDYPASELFTKKHARRSAVASIGGTPVFTSRLDARCAAERLLLRNRILFETRGPDRSDGSMNSPETAAAWSTAVLDEIVPNNRLLVALVEVNARLATTEDHMAAELLRQHTDDLERKHQSDVIIAPAQRFPPQAEHLFRSESNESHRIHD